MPEVSDSATRYLKFCMKHADVMIVFAAYTLLGGAKARAARADKRSGTSFARDDCIFCFIC